MKESNDHLSVLTSNANTHLKGRGHVPLLNKKLDKRKRKGIEMYAEISF